MDAILRSALSVSILSFLFAGCDGAEKTAPAGRTEAQSPAGGAATSLYDRLGGEKTLRAIVNDCVDRSVADPQVNFTRKGTSREWKASSAKLDHFKAHLMNLIAERAGGPQTYRGKDMKRVHRGMQIRSAEFDAFTGHLKTAMAEHRIPPREQGELMAIVESTRADIVEAGN